MKITIKLTCLLIGMMLSLTVTAATVCTCESGSMIVEITDDGLVKMSCSGGGRLSCTVS